MSKVSANEQKFVLERILDNSENLWDFWFSGFLEPSVIRQAEERLKSRQIQYAFFGGMEDSERKMLCLYPDYLEDQPIPWPFGAVSLNVSFIPEHRKILGTLMSLGIKRENLGDIVIQDGFIEIMVMDRMKDFILSEFSRLQGNSVKPVWIELDKIIDIPKAYDPVATTCASNRLDSVLGALFHLSRSEAQKRLQMGEVKLNDLAETKADRSVHPSDTIALRRKGKCRIEACEELTKKGRLRLEARRYK